MTWLVEVLLEFVDESKKGVIHLACDEELIVVGVSGWAGIDKVDDIKTGELKLLLKAINFGNTPKPFSHGTIYAGIGKGIIVTLGMN